MVSTGDGTQSYRGKGSSQQQIFLAEKSEVAGRERRGRMREFWQVVDQPSGFSQFLEFVHRLWLKGYFSKVLVMAGEAPRMGADIRKLGNYSCFQAQRTAAPDPRTWGIWILHVNAQHYIHCAAPPSEGRLHYAYEMRTCGYCQSIGLKLWSEKMNSGYQRCPA